MLLEKRSPAHLIAFLRHFTDRLILNNRTTSRAFVTIEDVLDGGTVGLARVAGVENEACLTH
jgi:hypothetical protein